MVQNGDIIFCCPDNDYCRRVLEDYCSENLSDFVLVTGGNTEDSWNAHIHVREGGEDKTPSVYIMAPHIAEAEEPTEEIEGCDDREDPQTIFINAMAASSMSMLYGNYLAGQYQICGVYGDMKTGVMIGIDLEGNEVTDLE